MKKKSFALLSALCLTLLAGCNNKQVPAPQDYQKISADKAYEMMNEESNLIILDVRTESEYASGHIANSLLLPYDQIKEKAESMLADKNAKILVYCHSGRRSAIAAKELASLGYTNVYDFGGIADWPYEITQ